MSYSLLTDDQKARIKACIDAYEWKHSWHLPHGSWGVDWGAVKTMEECLRVLADYERGARDFAAKCAEQAAICAVELERLRQVQREQEAAEQKDVAGDARE